MHRFVLRLCGRFCVGLIGEKGLPKTERQAVNKTDIAHAIRGWCSFFRIAEHAAVVEIGVQRFVAQYALSVCQETVARKGLGCFEGGCCAFSGNMTQIMDPSSLLHQKLELHSHLDTGDITNAPQPSTPHLAGAGGVDLERACEQRQLQGSPQVILVSESPELRVGLSALDGHKSPFSTCLLVLG